jgi:hypothetical protein
MSLGCNNYDPDHQSLYLPDHGALRGKTETGKQLST